MELQGVIDSQEGQVPRDSGSRRFNAVKHGLTAKTAVMPGEDSASFEATVDVFKTGLGTKDPFEDKLAATAALACWQLDRANRCEVARVSREILSRSKADELREATEAVGLGNRLFFDRRGPNQLYPSREYEHKQLRTSSSGEPDDADDPAKLLLLLQSTLAGCRWLLSAWSELREVLESGFGFQSQDKFRFCRLLGKQPLHAFHDRTVALVFLASHAIEPVYSYAFQELRCEIHEDQFKRKKSQLAQWSDRGIAPADATAARAALLSMIDRVTGRLRVLEAERQRAAEKLAALQTDILSFEEGKTGDQLRRHLGSCNRLMLRNVDAVERRHRYEAEGWGRTRKERESKKQKAEGGIAASQVDERLILDEHGTVLTADEYVEAGLARYDQALGYGEPRPRPAVVDEVVPVVADYARWAAEEQRRNAEEDDRRRKTADDDEIEPVSENADLSVGPDAAVPLSLAAKGDEANVQNEIADCEPGSLDGFGGAAERREDRSYAGALERGNGVPGSSVGFEGAAERREDRSHAGALERGIGESEPGSLVGFEDAAERREDRSYAGALERGNGVPGTLDGFGGAAERREDRSHAGALERGIGGERAGVSGWFRRGRGAAGGSFPRGSVGTRDRGERAGISGWLRGRRGAAGGSFLRGSVGTRDRGAGISGWLRRSRGAARGSFLRGSVGTRERGAGISGWLRRSRGAARGSFPRGSVGTRDRGERAGVSGWFRRGRGAAGGSFPRGSVGTRDRGERAGISGWLRGRRGAAGGAIIPTTTGLDVHYVCQGWAAKGPEGSMLEHKATKVAKGESWVRGEGRLVTGRD